MYICRDHLAMKLQMTEFMRDREALPVGMMSGS